MVDPRFTMSGHPSGDASYYRDVPRDSFMLTRFNIEPGQTVKICTDDVELRDQWRVGPIFATKHCIYVGSPDLWMLSSGTQCNSIQLTAKDVPMDTYRLPAPTFVNWPTFSCLGFPLQLAVENRGKVLGHFVARLAGEFAVGPVTYGGYPTHDGYDPERGAVGPRNPR